MKQKEEIINRIDINDDYAIVIVKKINETPKFCKDCPYSEQLYPMQVRYCNKYKGFVSNTDTCFKENI